ncbi:MAG: shikimate dehydrogenase [Bacteroidia bacterium]|nr:shikimate dehydrogenase [Bacteroidia bacterium]MDW8158250.1 shikimate dehydrogenase [Bacteroidia bacterium]
MEYLLGLVGKSLKHSFSPSYFIQKFSSLQIQCKYKLFELENIQEIIKILEHHPNLVGFNVTIPYKEAIIPFLQEIEETAAYIGAVNTVLRHPNGKWQGFNTDWYGFEQALLQLIKNSTIPPTIILGAGGSARAVVYALTHHLSPNNILICSRSPINSSDPIFKEINHIFFEELTPEMLTAYPLIINTTPLGMYPEIQFCPPIPIDGISSQNYVLDLIYNPKETLLLQLAKERGARIQNGLLMLQHQAEKAWEIWSSHWKF